MITCPECKAEHLLVEVHWGRPGTIICNICDTQLEYYPTITAKRRERFNQWLRRWMWKLSHRKPLWQR